MCYHLNGMDYVGDPYKIYGAKTSSELRELSKLVLNTAFNAASRGAAIASCNDAKRFKRKAAAELADSWSWQAVPAPIS